MDVEDIRRLAGQATELKDDPAFKEAILALRRQWFGELMIGEPDRQNELVCKLKALEAIPQQLQVLINDYQMVKGRMK